MHIHSWVVVGTPYAMGVNVLHMRSAVNLRPENFDSSFYCGRPQGLTQSSCSLFSNKSLGSASSPEPAPPSNALPLPLRA